MSERRILLVAGAPRSGTTLVMQILNLHPRVALFYECNFLQTLVLFEQLFLKARKGTANQRWITPRERFTGGDLARLIPTEEKCLHSTLEGIYRPVHPNKWWDNGLVWVGDKWNLLHTQARLSHLIGKYQVSVLWVTRNPVDVAASMVGRREMEAKVRPNRKDIMFSMLADWLQALRYAGWASKHWNMFHLQYEDFALRPDEWLGYICDWLGISTREEVKGSLVDCFPRETLDDLIDTDVHHRSSLGEEDLDYLLRDDCILEYRRFLRKMRRAPESLASLGPALPKGEEKDGKDNKPD